MTSTRNILVLKGRMNAHGVLDFLDRLIAKVVQGRVIKPSQLFSFICADGTSGLLAILLGYFKKSIPECRLILRDLEHASYRPNMLLPIWTQTRLPHVIRDIFQKHCDADELRSGFKKTALFGTQAHCDTMIWKARTDPSKPSKHLRSYRDNQESVQVEGDSVLDALEMSLGVHREFEPEQKPMEYPLHGMLHEVGMQDFRSHGVCIILEPPSVLDPDSEEARSDEEAKSGPFLENKRWFSFVLDGSRIGKADLEMAAGALQSTRVMQ